MRLLASIALLCLLFLTVRASAGPSLLYFVSAQEGAAEVPNGLVGEQLIPDQLGSSIINFQGYGSVSFLDGAHVVNGTNNYAQGGGYAAPILPTGLNYTQNYYSTELGDVTFDFSNEQTYFGVLWGSVDTESDGNLLSFYNNSVLISQITGSQLVSLAQNVQNFYDGSQLFGGTFYLNVYGANGGQFNEVVASSGVPSFEFAEVTVIDPPVNLNSVPEPRTIFLFSEAIFFLLAVIWLIQPRKV